MEGVMPTSTERLSLREQGLDLARQVEADPDAKRLSNVSIVSWYYARSFFFIYGSQKPISKFLNDDRLESLTDLIREHFIDIAYDEVLIGYCLKSTVDRFFVGSSHLRLSRALKKLRWPDLPAARNGIEFMREQRLVEDLREDMVRDRLGASSVSEFHSTKNLFEMLDALVAVVDAIAHRQVAVVATTTAAIHNQFAVCSPDKFYEGMLKVVRDE